MNDASDGFMAFSLHAVRQGANGTLAHAQDATVELDTSMAGRPDALNPVELLLASLSACIVKGVERVAPTIGFTFTAMDISMVARRPLDEARIEDIRYTVTFDTDASDELLSLVHKNITKFGTIYNTVKAGTDLSGTVTRR